mgnify:CR=1 FL=1
MTKAAELAKMGEVLTNSQIGGRRNIVINGAMQCSQRSTSETAQHTSGYLTLDRFNFNFVNEDELRTTLTQASEGPDGFANSLKVQATTAESAVAADEEFRVIYKVEAQDLQQLKFGTSAAERITVSFYVRSSVAATYGFNLYQNDANKVNGQAYTINSANTWERKTLTFIGNTSDVINDDNGIGMQLNWFLMAGSNFTSGSNSGWETFATAKHAVGHNANAVVTTTNATWQITGVQLEIGSQATPFEHRSFGEELALCQRYYQILNIGYYAANGLGTTKLSTGLPLASSMRAAPSAVTAPSSEIHRSGNQNSSSATIDSISLSDNGSFIFLRFTGFTSVTDEAAHVIYLNSDMPIDAEL